MIFRQLFDARSSTFTYLLGDAQIRDALLIDPVWEQLERDVALIEELGLRLRYTLETHVHADHVTSASLLRERLGSLVVLSRHGGADGADRLVEEGDRIELGRLVLEVRETPGHTNGCVTYVSHDPPMAFTGDALLVRGAGRTDFQEGNSRTLYRSVHENIFSLPDETLVYPAHDYQGRMCSSVGEERRFNPRLGGERSEGDFAALMDNLGLAHPKQIDVAVPANLECGRPRDGRSPPPVPEWAPVARTYAGVPEVPAHWLAGHSRDVVVVDVRDEAEVDGELGRIESAVQLPLSQLRDRLEELDPARPTVMVCRSGGRSAQAALILEKAGFERVANLAGGMIQWRAEGYATVGARPER